MPTNDAPTDDILIATALKYDREETPVPVLTAKGRGEVANKIVALAKEHNIPIRSDKDLVTILEKLELEQEIPMEIYAVVAEIFSYIYKLQQQRKSV